MIKIYLKVTVHPSTQNQIEIEATYSITYVSSTL